MIMQVNFLNLAALSRSIIRLYRYCKFLFLIYIQRKITFYRRLLKCMRASRKQSFFLIFLNYKLQGLGIVGWP